MSIWQTPCPSTLTNSLKKSPAGLLQASKHVLHLVLIIDLLSIDSYSATVYNGDMHVSEHAYSLEELAEMVGLSIRTIRYYISEGLLPGPGARGKAALYGEEHLLKLRLIRLLSRQHVPLVEVHARLLHLSLQEIRAILEEEEAQTALLEQTAQALPQQEYVAKLLRSARESRQASPAAPRYVVPHPDQLGELPAPAGRHGKNTQEEPPASRGIWQRWELAPGIEIHVRTESEHQHRSLLARLFQAAGKRYPPVS